jgi:type IV secretion system protein VirB5
MNKLPSAKTICLALLLAASSQARAMIPVIDVAALQQLIQQVMAWEQQLQGMRLQLTQLQQTRAALTGPRGMDQLLPLTPAARNYLPRDWGGLASVASGGGGADPALAQMARTQLEANSVLTAAELARLPQTLRTLLSSERDTVAATQALTRSAYAHSSERFASLATLIERIGGTADAKAIAELQGRIGAEQAMLANESAKLAALAQVTEAEHAAHELARRESVVQGHGAFAGRFQPVPPVP